MAKHAVKHRKRKNPTRRAIKAPAVSMACLLAGGLVLAPQPHTAASTVATGHQDVLLAASIVYIDGHNYPDSGTRMAQQLAGNNQYANCLNPCTHLTSAAGATPIFVQYSAKLGLLDGLGAPTGDQSINDGQTGIQKAIAASSPSAANPVTVVGYSEGAVAASHEVPNWTPGGPVSFVLISDAERPNGGILSRFPPGTYIPFIGITAGNATSSTGGPVVMVTRQYDGIGDAPAYPVNVLADANAVLGFYYLHGNYQGVNPNDPNTPKIVTTSPNGNMTDILILAPPGQLPILMPLAQVGVPQPILVALDPVTRAIIETGYNRTSDPSQQVTFALLPPVSALPGDAQMVVVGFVTTAQLLPGALIASAPGLPAVGPLTTITPLAHIGEALATMPGPIQPGENNLLTGVSSGGTAWTPLSSPVFSSAALPQQQSGNGPTTLVADISQAPPSGNPPAGPPSTPAPNIAGPITGALTTAVTNLSPFAIAPTGTAGVNNLGGGQANTTNTPGGNLVNAVTGTVNGAVTGVTGAVGGALGGLKSALSGQHNQ
jgi:hypothetical protein